jgi:hypothetical protein
MIVHATMQIATAATIRKTRMTLLPIWVMISSAIRFRVAGFWVFCWFIGNLLYGFDGMIWRMHKRASKSYMFERFTKRSWFSGKEKAFMESLCVISLLYRCFADNTSVVVKNG